MSDSDGIGITVLRSTSFGSGAAATGGSVFARTAGMPGDVLRFAGALGAGARDAGVYGADARDAGVYGARAIDARGAVAVLFGERVLVASFEAGADGGAARLVLDNDETPRLGQADRRRETGDGDQPLDRAFGKRIALEAPHVAPPFQEIVETRAKPRIELRRVSKQRSTRLFHHTILTTRIASIP